MITSPTACRSRSDRAWELDADLALDGRDGRIELLHVSRLLYRFAVLRERLDELRPVFEEHALQGFELEPDIAEGGEKFVLVAFANGVITAVKLRSGL